MDTTVSPHPGFPRVVIIGGGFGGTLRSENIGQSTGRRHAHRAYQPPLISALTLPSSNCHALARRHRATDPHYSEVRQEYSRRDGDSEKYRRVGSRSAHACWRVAHNILERVAGRPAKRFKYRDKGSMATIGRNKAIADLKFVKLTGFSAWLSWLLIHLLFIVELRNRIVIIFQWAWAYITYQHGARLSYRAFRPAVPPDAQRVSAEDVL